MEACCGTLFFAVFGYITDRCFCGRMVCFLVSPDSISDDTVALLEGIIPDWRVKKASSFLLKGDRKVSLLGYFLVVAGLKALGMYNGMPQFGYGEWGKPYLLNYEGVEFNISHCRGGVAVCLDSRRVGLDVEDTLSFDAELARAVCSDAEFAEIVSAVSPGEAFTRLWTRKEAVMKYYGTGMCDGDSLKRILCDDSVDLRSYRLDGGAMYMSLCIGKL